MVLLIHDSLLIPSYFPRCHPLSPPRTPHVTPPTPVGPSTPPAAPKQVAHRRFRLWSAPNPASAPRCSPLFVASPQYTLNPRSAVGRDPRRPPMPEFPARREHSACPKQTGQSFGQGALPPPQRPASRPANHMYGATHRSGHQSGTPQPNLPGAPHRPGTNWGTSTQSGPPPANSYHPSLANNYGHPPPNYGSPAQPPANYNGPIRPNNYGQPLAINYAQAQTNNNQPAPPPPNNYGPQPPNNNGPPPAINYGHPPSNYYGSPLTNNDHRQFPNTYGLGPTGNYDSDIYGVGVLPPNNICEPMINPIQDPGNNYCIAAGNNYSVLPVANHRAPSVLSQPGHPTNMNTTRVSDNIRNPHSNQDHARRTNDYNYAATPGSADPHASGHLSHVGPTAQGHLIAPGGRISNYNNDPNCDLGSSGHLTSRHHPPALLPLAPASYTLAFEDGLNPGDEFHELQSSFAANRIDDAGSLILGSNPSLSATFGKAAVDSSLGALIGRGVIITLQHSLL
ncbi:hypothetical protein PGTUg99_003730 [Puccinia graminis f. sp. tritici]|uniref:Uncharacterized protein n=1 Tax=Puccinia graminis f. sp. tritici TaxID=56615 RepID=A0A5B0QGK3_PUCGR|nr:hypothetical protein PGTUg99_003730 [Puccinia graminis f. sp. tritici]